MFLLLLLIACNYYITKTYHYIKLLLLIIDIRLIHDLYKGKAILFRFKLYQPQLMITPVYILGWNYNCRSLLAITIKRPYTNVDHREYEVDHDTFASLLSLIMDHILTMQFKAH